MYAFVFKYSGTPSLSEPSVVRQHMKRALGRAGLEQNHIESFLTAITEIVVNLVKHSTPTATQYHITVRRMGRAWRMDVKDNGGPADAEIFSRTMTGNAEQDSDDKAIDLRTSGYGIALINTLFTQVIYQAGQAEASGSGYNCLSLVLDAGQPEDKQTILIVDDDRVLLTLYHAYLGDDYHVLEAVSAADALKLIKTENVDLIISDIEMPGVNGLDFRRTLQVNNDTALVPFIILTGLHGDNIASQADALSIDAFMTKPAQKAELKSMVKRCLKRAKDVQLRLGQIIEDRVTRALHPSMPETFGPYRTQSAFVVAEMGGGDFLFARRISPTRTRLFIGDIMGHGPTAKFFVFAMRGYLDGVLASLSRQGTVDDLLEAVSGILFEQPIMAACITTLLVVDLCDDGSICWASAGHPPPIVLRQQSGEETVSSVLAEVLKGGVGPLLGLLPSQGYTHHVCTLGPSDKLIIMTDGLIEAVDKAGHDFIPEPLLNVISESASAPWASSASFVLEAALSMAEVKDRDDALIAMVEFCPS